MASEKEQVTTVSIVGAVLIIPCPIFQYVDHLLSCGTIRYQGTGFYQRISVRLAPRNEIDN